MARYTEIFNEVENNFRVPEYLDQKIRYVSDKNAADICVSARHTLGDYLILGITALSRSINGVSGDILVYNDVNPKTETIGICEGPHAPLKKIDIQSELFLQVDKSIDNIYSNLSNAETFIVGVGLSIVTQLEIQFSDYGQGISKSVMDELQFTHFDDLLTAQKNAFTLVKKMSATIMSRLIYSLRNN